MSAEAEPGTRNAVPLRTERLRLRDFTSGDFDAVHAYASDPRVTDNLCWGPNTPEQTRAFLDKAARETRAVPRTGFSLGIEETAVPCIIGGIHIHPHGREAGTRELGYCLHPDFWGRGLASEAASAIVAFGFETLQARRLVAEVFASNAASTHILEKLGFHPGATFERHITHRDERHRARLFTLDRDTWLQGGH